MIWIYLVLSDDKNEKSINKNKELEIIKNNKFRYRRIQRKNK